MSVSFHVCWGEPMKYILRLLRIAAVAGFGAAASGVHGVPVNAQVISNPHVQLTYLTPHNLLN
jgi:hypothetical protein